MKVHDFKSFIIKIMFFAKQLNLFSTSWSRKILKQHKAKDYKLNIVHSIQKLHASVNYDNDEVVLKPLNQGAKTKVNGAPLTGEQKLEHNDRVLFGKLILQN